MFFCVIKLRLFSQLCVSFAEYKQSIESNLSDTLGISRPPPTNGPIVIEEPEEGTITPEATPRAR